LEKEGVPGGSWQVGEVQGFAQFLARNGYLVCILPAPQCIKFIYLRDSIRDVGQQQKGSHDRKFKLLSTHLTDAMTEI
jgi:hypothetical protein